MLLTSCHNCKAVKGNVREVLHDTEVRPTATFPTSIPSYEGCRKLVIRTGRLGVVSGVIPSIVLLADGLIDTGHVSYINDCLSPVHTA